MGDVQTDTRALIERAVTILTADAPPGWKRLRAEFDLESTPVAARGQVTHASGAAPLLVPAGAVDLVIEYRRRAAAGAPRIVVEYDNTGALAVHADPPHRAASGNRRRCGALAIGVSAALTVASVAVLLVAIQGRDRGDGPTLRAMVANESMSDEQARAISETTMLVWLRERNERHLANLEALSCSDRQGTVAREVEAVKNHDPVAKELRIVAFGNFFRDGPAWLLNTHFEPTRFPHTRSVMTFMRVQDGVLRVCAFGPTTIP
ncbi:hypothetical protein [Mycobacteroides salmoniphilum]|uniref:hypothetical protein n=1 Tax=Mycobacteroides salmoniphilum TaxID=404941 RepID=UPI0010AA63CA|nr:hypothetical protein [Mycobacteroides salmoniphilum]QCH25765.1 hypothetical protein DSM43276_04051 [Mycobacteroides salmoniphilum]